MIFEDLLNKVGSFGRYQGLLMLFVFYTTFMCGVNYYAQVFIFATPPHRCRNSIADLEHLDHFDPIAVILNRSMDLKHLDRYHSECQRPAVNVTGDIKAAELVTILENTEYESCTDGWVYDLNATFPTLTSEHNWVCDYDYRPSYMHQLFWIGNTVGCFFWGFTNDHFGRRPTVLVTHALYIVGGILTLLASGFWTLLVARFIVGMVHHTVSHLPYLIAVEYCGPSSRIIPLFVMMFSYSCASLSIPFLAMALPSWRSLCYVAVVPNALVLLAWKIVPESPSWLLCEGKAKEAKRMLTIISKVNGTFDPTLEEDVEDVIETEAKSRAALFQGNNSQGIVHSVKALIKCKRLLWHGLLSVLVCVVGFMCYYGHVQNTSNLGSDIYWSFFLGAVVEMPCYSVPYIINPCGRRWTLLALFLASGVMSVGVGFVPQEYSSWSLAFALLGRMFVTGAYYICLQFASEIFPTVVRGKGVALCEIMGGIGLFLCPMIVYLAKYEASLPLTIFGLLSFVGSAATFFLPETVNHNLPQTLSDGNGFGADQGYFNCIACQRNHGSPEKEEGNEFHNL